MCASKNNRTAAVTDETKPKRLSLDSISRYSAKPTAIMAKPLISSSDTFSVESNLQTDVCATDSALSTPSLVCMRSSQEQKITRASGFFPELAPHPTHPSDNQVRVYSGPGTNTVRGLRLEGRVEHENPTPGTQPGVPSPGRGARNVPGTLCALEGEQAINSLRWKEIDFMDPVRADSGCAKGSRITLFFALKHSLPEPSFTNSTAPPSRDQFVWCAAGIHSVNK
ncbi:hypothetical protein CBL_12865 [Carabus blaptoides fortunei]